MPIYTETKIRFWGKGSNQIYKWAQDGGEGVFFARVFGYDYENATEDDWDDWEYEFDSYRVDRMYCNVTKCDDSTILLDMIVIGTPPHGVFKKIAETFPHIHADGIFIMQDEEFFGNLVIENGGYLWTKFDNPGRRSGKRNFRFESFFYDSEEDQNRFPAQKVVLDLLKFDRDNMRSLLAEGKGFFKRHEENKPKELNYESKFYFSEDELKAIAGDADSQYELAMEMLEGEYYDNNPKIYNKRDKIERKCYTQDFREMGQSWLEKAAMNGNPDAQYRIFKQMDDTLDEAWDDSDEETTKNANMLLTSKIAKLFAFSLKNGSEEAIDDVMESFEYSEYAQRIIKRLANQNSLPAIWALANYYDGDDLFVVRDKKNYMKWLQKAVDLGDSEAMWVMADRIIKDHPSHDEIEKAIALLEKARVLGESDATDDLASLYAFGEIVEKDVPKALKYLEETADEGYFDSKKYLFACSECGIYTFPSESKREEFRIEVSKYIAECFSGDDTFATALGIEKDSVKYIEWLNTAVNNGSKDARYELGKAYYEGKHVNRDYKKAFDCFLPSVHLSKYDGSWYYLGLMYLNGEYVPQNLFMAEKWFKFGSRREKAKEQLKKIKEQIESEKLLPDEKELARMNGFEKAVQLVFKKKYEQAIALFYELGDYLDSPQRMKELIPLFSQKFNELLSKGKTVQAQKTLNQIPRGSDDLNNLCARLEQAIRDRKYSVGEVGPAGGIIVYAKEDRSDGWQYMEVATSAVEYRIWGKTENLGTETKIGSGRENTNKIVSAANKGKKTAAQACLDYEQNGYKDWFLPSKDELSKLMILLGLPKDSWKREKYCEKHFGSKNIATSSEVNEFKMWYLNLMNNTMMMAGKEYSDGLRCIPFRMF